MRYWLAATVALGVLATGMLPAPAEPAPTRAASAAAAHPSTLVARTYLHPGHRLVSANGRYSASVGSTGRLVVRSSTGRAVWIGPATGRNAVLHLSRTGQLSVEVAGKVRWAARTAGSGAHDVLTMRNDGVLALTSGGAAVWSTRLPNGCPRTTGKTFVVHIGTQTGRMCSSGQQLRVTYVTTGASARGDGTPTGTWHVQARIRNTTLYPASGGAYHVRYWMPYDGAYGVHDSPWQTFRYGSPAYRTRGSHGCVHVPEPMMAWLFGWARVGTRVTISH